MNFFCFFSKNFLNFFLEHLKEDRRNLFMKTIERFPDNNRADFEFCSKPVFPMSSRHYILTQSSFYDEKRSVIVGSSIERPEIPLPPKAIRSEVYSKIFQKNPRIF